MKFIRNHRILVSVLVLLTSFISFNLLRERDIKRVVQTNTPSNEEVKKAVGDNTQPVPHIPSVDSANGVLRSGTFIGKKGHDGQGTARVVLVDSKPVLQLDDSFKTSSGPDLQIYLSKNSDVDKQGLGEFVTLGSLQSTSGAQVYSLPDNHADYQSVVVWCRGFTTLFAQATLQ